MGAEPEQGPGLADGAPHCGLERGGPRICKSLYLFITHPSYSMFKTQLISFSHCCDLQHKGETVPLNVFQIVFEAQRGKGVGGEIGLDNVVLTSGPCQEDVGPAF